MASGNGTHDKPGSYRVIDGTGLAADQIRQALDQAEVDGYEWVGVNNTMVFLYKKAKH